MMLVGEAASTAVAVHDSESPTDEEWNEWLRLFAKMDEERRLLVYTEGASPSAAQRQQFFDVSTGSRTRIAILHSSRVVQMVSTALAWFGLPLRTFGLDEENAAADYLDLEGDGRRRALETLKALKERLHARRSA